MLKNTLPEPLQAPADTEPDQLHPAVHEEPATGGSYLRDPVTGALTPNPASKE